MATENVNGYISIGRFAATHGLQGFLVLKHVLGKKTTLKGLKAVFIKDKTGSFIPWFLESSKVKTDSESYIKLEGINTMEAARPLVQKEVWLTEADFRAHTAKNAPISLLHYTIINDDEELGAIQEIIEQPHQVLCRLEINGKEVLIPLHEETLIKVDNKAQKVYVSLPEGLLDIYLS
ncbi:Ribosome maturation factor RimM [Mycovorax composti]|jgi:16S rRNA processing protein RimM|uniref:Ribosome maturation factor RimM n=2 Tax=Chitinophagaceae TaxID=563835 RepID=A0ABZ2EIL1_9BACT